MFGVHANQVVGLDAWWGPFDLYLLLANGEHGVSLFFSLSGFLLSLPFWRALAQDADWPRPADYALRRAVRILPAYYLLLTLLVLASGLWRVPGGWADVAAHYLMVFNYFEFSFFSLNPPFWTLAVEAQFYLLLPLLFLALARLPRRAALPAVVALGALAWGASWWLVGAVDGAIPWPADPVLTWIRPGGAVVTHSLLAHLPHFLMGTAAAWVFLRASRQQRSHPRLLRRVAEALFWGAAAALLLLLSTPWGEALALPRSRYGLPLVPALLTLLLLAAPFATVASRVLESPPLRALGVLSYGVYLYHYPVLMLVDRQMAARGLDAAQRWPTFVTLGLALTLLAATLSWLLVERPVARWARRRRG